MVYLVLLTVLLNPMQTTLKSASAHLCLLRDLLVSDSLWSKLTEHVIHHVTHRHGPNFLWGLFTAVFRLLHPVCQFSFNFSYCHEHNQSIFTCLSGFSCQDLFVVYILGEGLMILHWAVSGRLMVFSYAFPKCNLMIHHFVCLLALFRKNVCITSFWCHFLSGDFSDHPSVCQREALWAFWTVL